MAFTVKPAGNTSEDMSWQELLAWVNGTLECSFNSVEELRTGAAYCQLMDMMFPGCLPLERVRFHTNLDYEFIRNLSLLQNTLVRLKVNRIVPTTTLVMGGFEDNVKFLLWFKQLFDANYDGKEYNARAARKYAPMGYGLPR